MVDKFRYCSCLKWNESRLANSEMLILLLNLKTNSIGNCCKGNVKLFGAVQISEKVFYLPAVTISKDNNYPVVYVLLGLIKNQVLLLIKQSKLTKDISNDIGKLYASSVCCSQKLIQAKFTG